MIAKDLGAKGTFTSATITEKLALESAASSHLAPGALWRRVETQPQNIMLGKVIGEGASATVHKGTFQDKTVAIKIFRNATEEKAFKEIEMMFSLRHPNIVGLYAWFQLRGAMTQLGVVMEWAGGGDLRTLYQDKSGHEFSFKLGLKIVGDVAKGIVHMQSMPEPVIHRDIKSMNVLVMDDFETGKVADCGESRRVDLNATMTRVGSPLWAAVSCWRGGRLLLCCAVLYCAVLCSGAPCSTRLCSARLCSALRGSTALLPLTKNRSLPSPSILSPQPELLAGKRYCEDVDTYSFGVVLYEVAARELPYLQKMKASKASGEKGLKPKIMSDIAQGRLRPELEQDVCRRYGIGSKFKKRESISMGCAPHRNSIPTLPTLSISKSSANARGLSRGNVGFERGERANP